MTRSYLLAVATLALGGCATVSVDMPVAAAEAPNENPGQTYRVYFLGGQSNMEGFGFTDELSADLRSPTPIPIFHGKTVGDGKPGGGVGTWTMLRPGQGTGFDADSRANTYSDRFGPELTFGREIGRLQPNQRIAIIKYARGGTGLIDGVSGYGSWDPDYTAENARNQYDNALTAIDRALTTRDIDGDGHRDTLVPAGIVWMQGEADAYDNEPAANNYANNLARLMRLLRAALKDDDLPVVIGRIRDSGDSEANRVMKFSPLVRAQQGVFVEDDACAALVTATDEVGFLGDGWHYLSNDYVTLGREFAKSMHQLEARCGN